jgi:hypothetical protein
MPICLKDGFGRLTQIMEVTKLMRNLSKDLRYRLTNGVLSIRDDPTNGHGKMLFDFLS